MKSGQIWTYLLKSLQFRSIYLFIYFQIFCGESLSLAPQTLKRALEKLLSLSVYSLDSSLKLKPIVTFFMLVKRGKQDSLRIFEVATLNKD